jgi:hypothetical protein
MTMGMVGTVTEDVFNGVVRVGLVNQGSNTVVFTNIRVYVNQDIDNYNIDKFTNVDGVPLTHTDVTLLPGSRLTLVFSSPVQLQSPTYAYATADLYSTSDPNELYNSGEAVSTSDLSAP